MTVQDFLTSVNTVRTSEQQQQPTKSKKRALDRSTSFTVRSWDWKESRVPPIEEDLPLRRAQREAQRAEMKEERTLSLMECSRDEMLPFLTEHALSLSPPSSPGQEVAPTARRTLDFQSLATYGYHPYDEQSELPRAKPELSKSFGMRPFIKVTKDSAFARFHPESSNDEHSTRNASLHDSTDAQDHQQQRLVPLSHFASVMWTTRQKKTRDLPADPSFAMDDPLPFSSPLALTAKRFRKRALPSSKRGAEELCFAPVSAVPPHKRARIGPALLRTPSYARERR